MTEMMQNLPARLEDTPAREDSNWTIRYDLDASVRDMVADIRGHRYVYKR